MRSSKKSFQVLALLAGVAMVGGVAWAAETLSINLPSSSTITVTATVEPTTEGSVVCGIRETDWDELIDLDIGFDPTGDLLSYGQVVGTYDGSHVHEVRGVFRDTPAGWRADITVRDLDTGSVIHQANDVDIGDRGPEVATATADVVVSLTAQ